MLTIWDWAKEKVLLRSKAFSQDVYRVTFSPDNPQQLTTSGTGHIRYSSSHSGQTPRGYLVTIATVSVSLAEVRHKYYSSRDIVSTSSLDKLDLDVQIPILARENLAKVTIWFPLCLTCARLRYR